MPSCVRTALLLPLGLAACSGGSASQSRDGGEPFPDRAAADVLAPDMGPPPCDRHNRRPDTPLVIAPEDGSLAVEPADLVLRGSPYADADGHAHAGAEYEVWLLDGQSPVERVWHLATSAGRTEATLAEGDYQGSAALNGGLDQWKWHMARVRYHDGESSECGWSVWSPSIRFRTEDGSSYLFDPAVVREFHLTIPPESWDPIHAEAYPPGCVPWQRQFYTADLELEGRTFPGVGLRVKGGCGSSRNLDQKAGFRVALNWDDLAVPGCPAERELYGQRHLTFNNLVQDASFAHERLAYRLYEAAGVPVPRVAHVRLSVNGEYWGLYLLVETVKRRFLDRRFESKGGMLYEGTYWCDLVSANVPPNDEDTYCLTREFSPDPCDDPPEPDEDPQDYGPLREMVTALEALPPDGFYPEIESLWNYPAFLSAWTVEAILGHWDNYSFQIMNNYRVYRDPSTDLWNLIPHGLDQTFSDDRDPWNVSGTLAARCLQEADCEQAMVARLEAVNDRFESLGLGAELGAIHDLIQAHVHEDPRKEISNDSFEAQYPGLAAWIGWRPWRVREHIAAHGY